MQQLVFVQIVDLLRPAIAFEIGGRRDHTLGRLGQLAGAQGAVFQLTNTHGHVEPFRDQFNIAVVQDHVHCDVGEFLKERRQDRGQVIDAKVGRHRNPQQAPKARFAST